jgi:cobalamin biosynthesis protein CobT
MATTTNLSSTKSVLAKLLAGENLNVVHDSKIKTAMFDTKNRTLYLPVWEVMDGELYDLLVGHEDGHALYTPHDAWSGAIDANKKKTSFKDCLNIIEDARIEKMIKRKYPGLARSFSAGYRQLFERDFFGVKKLADNYDKLNIMDRINLYFKCGSFILVPFSDEERLLVREIGVAETFDEVIELALRLSDLAKKESKEDKDSIKNIEDLAKELEKILKEGFEGSLGAEKNESSSGDDDSDEEKSASSNDDDSSSSSSSDDEDESPASSSSSSPVDDESSPEAAAPASSDGESGEDVIESVTDHSFRQKQEELVVGGVEINSYSLPEPILKNIIIPGNIITENFFEGLKNANAGRNLPIVKTCVDKFNMTNKRYIAMLIKEFEMRKNANQFARTTVARTGELDMGKLHNYKFNNDLFRKISVVQKGKSHGLVLFLDMSASMRPVFGPTMEQTLILATFCKRIGVPFDVYGFSDDAQFKGVLFCKRTYNDKPFMGGMKFSQKKGDDYVVMNQQNFHLLHLLGSHFSPTQYKASFEMLAVVSMNFENRIFPQVRIDWNSVGFHLNGTPFIPATLASRPLIENFKKDRQVDVVNVIYLTDGDGTSGIQFSHSYSSSKKRYFLVDQKTKQKKEVSSSLKTQQKNLVEFVRELTGCKHIGFYLATDSYIKSMISEDATMNKFYKENGYVSKPHIGYDMYYYMRTKASNIQDSDFEIDGKMTNTKISNLFSDAQQDKKRNRALVMSLAKELTE